jgi:uncharacterized protein involved in exopolysaccharide biosynthesis
MFLLMGAVLGLFLAGALVLFTRSEEREDGML